MITYRKVNRLRLRRYAVPEPPFWASSAIEPYSAPRGVPISIDYLQMRARGSDRDEVEVCDNIADSLSRYTLGNSSAPVLVEATGFCERVFLRGSEALGVITRGGEAAVHLVSADGELPLAPGDSRFSLVIAAWPAKLGELRRMAGIAEVRQLRWGIFIPLIFPITTELAFLQEVAEIATTHEGSFLAASSLELEPSAKKEIGSILDSAGDSEAWDMLFHDDMDALQISSERHVAALASEHGLADFIVPPDWKEKTNWNAAILLSVAAHRLIRLGEDELGWTILRSARTVAELGKDLTVVANAASLSIIESLDEISAENLEHWLKDERTPYFDEINDRWRLRRDHRPLL